MKESWNLDKYFYESINSEKYLFDRENIEELVKEFILKYKNKIKLINDDLAMLKFLEDEEKLDIKIGRVVNFISMQYYLDSNNELIQKEMMRIENLMQNLSERMLFVQEEIKEIGEERLIKFSKSKTLEKYQNYFYQISVNLKYQLSDEVERALLINSDSGVSNQVKLYEDLNSSYQIKFEDKMYSEDELLTKLESTNQEIRKKAYITLVEFYQNEERVKTHHSIYISVIKDTISSMKLRGFKTPISAQNISEELSDKAVDTMLDTIKSYSYLYERFLNIKKKVLKLDELNIWDVFAPVSQSSKKINYGDSCSIMYGVFDKFNLNQKNFAKDMIENGRVDVVPRKGKSQGAFALYSKDEESFILLNHTNNLSSLYTLVHEMGHAYHGFLSQSKPTQCFESSLVLAESASIFNELLLTEHLKETLKKDELISTLVRELDETCANVFKQTQYVFFEKEVYQDIFEGGEYSSQDLSKKWREISKSFSGSSIKYFGEDSCEISWQRIPHLYRSPFYCYSYSFGNLLSLALYFKYQEGEEDFISKYENLLSLGGSKTPQESLKEFGFDLESKEFYERGLKIIERKIEELEKII